MNKFVVFTVIVGDYDKVKQPLIIDKRFDYVLFSDTLEENSMVGIWHARAISYESDKNYKKARYPRLQPEKLLPDYDAWLYHDGNIQITSQWVYDRCIELFNGNIEWAGIKHQWRNSAFEEIDWMLKAAWVHDYEVLPWYRYLLSQGYTSLEQQKQGFLFETGIIFRRHTGNVKKVNDIWWWSIDEGYVKRDQFSLMYALWKVPEIKTGFFLSENENAWNNRGHFAYTNHNPHKRVLPWSVWETIRHRCFRAKYGDEASYSILLDKVCATRNPHRALQWWTLSALFTQGWKVVVEMIKCRLPKKS